MIVAVLVALALLTAAGPALAAGTYQIPAAIPSDCSADVTQPILTWLAAVPDNSVASFGAGACYRIDGTLELTNRNGLDFEGNGATFRAGSPGGASRAQWRVVGGSGFVFRNMTVEGSNPAPGTMFFNLQWQHAFDLRGAAGVEIDHTVASGLYGDCVYVGQGWDSAKAWSSNVHVHDTTCAGNGRMGVAVTAGHDVLVERSSFSSIARTVFDVEPNGAGFGGRNVTFTNNQATGPLPGGFFTGLGDGPVDSITVSNNRANGVGMYLAVLTPQGQRRSNIVVTGNSSDTGYYAPGSSAMDFQRIDGLTVTGNSVPLSGPNMSLAWVSESCNVNVSGNSFPGGVAEARIDGCGADPPPTVELTAPADGATFSSKLALSAAAHDNEGVSKVQFWAGSTLLSTDYSAPYSYTWSPSKQKFPYGVYTVKAKAFDKTGQSASDSAVVSRLVSTSITLRVSRGSTVKASSGRRLGTKRVHGRVRGSRSGWVTVRVQRFDRGRHRWVRAASRRIHLRHHKYSTRLRGLRDGRWRARATFRGTRKRAPSRSAYRYFRIG